MVHRNAVTNFPAEQYPDLAIEAGGEDPAAGVGQGKGNTFQ